MKVFFDQYQRFYKPINRLEFLYSCLNLEHNNEEEFTLIQYLLYLEQSALSIVSKLKLEECESELRNRIEKNSNNVWLKFTLVLFSFRRGKLDKGRCLEAIQILKDVSNEFYPEQPSFYLFYYANIYYELSKTQKDINECLFSLSEARKSIEKLMKNYKSELNDNKDFYGIIYNTLGNILMKEDILLKRDYSGAEKSFNEALRYNPNFSHALNGLGNIYRERCIFKEAINYYCKAIKVDRSFTYPWNYLGDCFRMIEKYDEAIRFYNQALIICEGNQDIIKAIPLYGLGRVYYELGNRNNGNIKYYEKAMHYFEGARKLLKDELPQSRYLLKDMARLRQKQKNYLGAIEIYKIIKENNLFFKQEYYISIIGKYIDECYSLLARERKCEDATKSSNTIDPLESVMCQISHRRIEERVAEMKESFELSFLKIDRLSETEYQQIIEILKDNEIFPQEVKRYQNNNAVLKCLKRWNSYTPIINNSRGGGYYLKIENIGIVIDPGHSFINNYKETNGYFQDIDLVLISHSHDDHMADLESILNMQHRYNTRLKKDVIPREIAKEERISVNDITMQKKSYENLINERYILHKKDISFFISNGAFTKFSGYLNDEEKCEELKSKTLDEWDFMKKHASDKSVFYKVISAKEKINVSDNVKITVLEAKHEDLFSKCNCYGFMIETPLLIFVYTGDTGWCEFENEELKTESSIFIQYSNLRTYAQSRNKKIILLAHIGGFKDDENKYWDSQSEAMYYKNHLGRCGLTKLVMTLNPNLCIISEFGEEFNGVRIELSNIYNKAFKRYNKHSIVFLPADIDLEISLDSKRSDSSKLSMEGNIQQYEDVLPTVKVISKIDFNNRYISYEFVEPSKVIVGEYRFKNLLFYYKKNANITEADCIQALIEGFERTEIGV